MRSTTLREIQQAFWIGRGAGFELGERASKIYLEYETGAVDAARLEAAVNQLVQRHEMLRAVVAPPGELHIADDARHYAVTVRDLRDRSGAELAAARAAVRRELCGQDRPPDRWPLFDVDLTRLPLGRTLIHLRFDLLVADGASSDVFSRELARLYEAPDAPLAPLALSYTDYVEREPTFAGPDVEEQARKYWSDYVAQLPPAPALPRVHEPGPADCRALMARLAAAEWQAVKAIGHRRGLLPSSILLAAYAEIVAAHAESRRFVLNLPLSSRLPIDDDVQRLIGVFTSPTLFGVDMSGRDSFADRARRLQKELAAHWREGRFARMHGVREYARRMGGQRAAAPVVFTQIPPAPSDAARLFGEMQHWQVQTPQVRLENQVRDAVDGTLLMSWNFAAETFPPGAARRMLDGYVDALHRLADESAWTRTPLAVVPAGDLAVQAELNRTEVALPGPEVLHAGLLRSIAAHPDRIAVIGESRALTYAELGAVSLDLARGLAARGVGPGHLVAIVVHKSWPQVAAALAILRAGAAYVPIDSGLPIRRIRDLLADCGAAAAVTTAELDRALDWPAGLARLVVDEGARPGVADPGEPDPGESRPSDVAYVIYTSGSTGKPKGVVIEHGAAVNTLADVNRRFAMTAADRVLAISSMSFDLSVYDVFGVLGVGGSLVIPDGERLRDPAYLADLVRRHRVTLWNSVPALLQMTAEWTAARGRASGEPASARRDGAGALDSLRLVMLSGDWLPVALPPLLRSICPRATLVNLGGATEASVWSIFHVVERLDPDAPSVPYGRPLANQTFAILDEALEPRPLGVPGHLHIGGRGLAREYLGDPETTARRFFHHPATGERLYRTGDLGRHLPDGTIEFLGREDFQVKIQGHRIELGEIESVLLQHEQVRACAVKAVDGPGGRALAAYVVADGEPAPSAPELARAIQAFARERLPAYMVPPFVVVRDALPLSANGKVDRGRLPDPRSIERVRTGRVAAHGPTEAIIQSIWQEILGCSVSATDSFFDLGGTSFAASRMLLQVEQALGRQVGIAALMRAPTVEALARELSAGEPGRPRMLVPLGPTRSGRPLYLVHPTGGNVLCYAEVARRLDSRAPFALQARGLLAGESPDPSVEAMARSCADAIIAHAPLGSIALAGWSMGGVIAFETARQLRARGAAIELVALVDSVAPALGRSHIPIDEPSLLAAFARDLGLDAGAAAAARRRAERDGIDAALRALFHGDRAGPAAPSSSAETLWRVFRTNLLALRAYEPAPYAGPVTLIRAADGFARGLGAPLLGWPPLVEGGLSAIEVPGDHYSALRISGGRAIAEALEASLAAPRGKSRNLSGRSA
jgi:pyochelin synthetase